MTICIWFARGRGFSASMSRRFLLSPWDRVALSFDSTYIYESVPSVGVTIRTIERFEKETTVKMKYEIDVPNPDQLRQFIGSKLHCGFNWWRFLGFKGFKQYNETHYISSEFIVDAIKASGKSFKTHPIRQTPFIVWLALVTARIKRSYPLLNSQTGHKSS